MALKVVPDWAIVRHLGDKLVFDTVNDNDCENDEEEMGRMRIEWAQGLE